MGFPEIRSKRALINTHHSGAEAAMAWLCEHFEDPDIDAPLEVVPQGAGPSFNVNDLNSLISMGFPEIRCKRALIKTNHSGAETAMSWLFEHMEDADIDAPLESIANAPTFSENDISSLVDMGFTAAQAKRALKETGNEMQRAVDWLFSHSGDSEVTETGGPISKIGQLHLILEYDSNPAKYELFAFISHRGTSAHCGHYVAYIKKAVGWVLFNDNKVVLVPDIKKYVSDAYIYIYRRQ